MYVVAIAATLFTIMCLETMHIITRRYGEKSVMLTISPVTGEQLTGILDQIRKSNFEIDSFSLSNDSASIVLHMRQRNYQKTIGKLLEITKGYKVEIS